METTITISLEDIVGNLIETFERHQKRFINDSEFYGTRLAIRLLVGEDLYQEAMKEGMKRLGIK